MDSSILVIRLSAMGDIIHTLPAITTLKESFPNCKLIWLVARRWMPLLESNPYIDEMLPFDRGNLLNAKQTFSRLRSLRPEIAFDFQGLVQSAVAGRLARPKALFGFARSVAREPFASLLYSHAIPVKGPHRVERAVQLAQAAGAARTTFKAWIPAGQPQGDLPSEPFILASPFAGWAGKEWPLASYNAVAELLAKEGLQLVANVTENKAHELNSVRHVRPHVSALPGLIDATRRATAVLGVDSGPLHLAAALDKPGVGLYGPTDPALTGPFGGSMTVLRTRDVETTYKRHAEMHASMREITPEQVVAALLNSVTQASRTAVQGSAISRS